MNRLWIGCLVLALSITRPAPAGIETVVVGVCTKLVLFASVKGAQQIQRWHYRYLEHADGEAYVWTDDEYLVAIFDSLTVHYSNMRPLQSLTKPNLHWITSPYRRNLVEADRRRWESRPKLLRHINLADLHLSKDRSLVSDPLFVVRKGAEKPIGYILLSLSSEREFGASPFELTLYRIDFDGRAKLFREDYGPRASEKSEVASP